jgi:hypothetical protein
MAYVGQTGDGMHKEQRAGDNAPSNETPQKKQSISSLSLFVIIFCYIAYGMFLFVNPNGGFGAKILALGIFFVATPVCVCIGGFIGNLICPQFIIASGAQALLKERLFWWVGPRFIGAGIAALVTTMLVVPEVLQAAPK